VRSAGPCDVWTCARGGAARKAVPGAASSRSSPQAPQDTGPAIPWGRRRGGGGGGGGARPVVGVGCLGVSRRIAGGGWSPPGRISGIPSTGFPNPVAISLLWHRTVGGNKHHPAHTNRKLGRGKHSKEARATAQVLPFDTPSPKSSYLTGRLNCCPPPQLSSSVQTCKLLIPF